MLQILFYLFAAAGADKVDSFFSRVQAWARVCACGCIIHVPQLAVFFMSVIFFRWTVWVRTFFRSALLTSAWLCSFKFIFSAVSVDRETAFYFES